jgi:hypothetical protein
LVFQQDVVGPFKLQITLMGFLALFLAALELLQVVRVGILDFLQKTAEVLIAQNDLIKCLGYSIKPYVTVATA